jgi:hypothetical protein
MWGACTYLIGSGLRLKSKFPTTIFANIMG